MVDINPFIQTSFGAIVGGGVVVATNWISTHREKRKTIQEWYEQRYITEGVDCLTTYFTYLLLCFSNPDETDLVSLPNTPIPVEALTRIEFLLGRRETVSGGIEGLRQGSKYGQKNLTVSKERVAKKLPERYGKEKQTVPPSGRNQ